jgi:asparagine synthetase B (glutamine-hydrolysing)
LYDHSERTFWQGITSLPAGHFLTWQSGQVHISCWYDLAERVGPEFDDRPVEVVQDEYLALLTDSVRLRFRSDVPVGINLSGGLDSSTLLGLVRRVQGAESAVGGIPDLLTDGETGLLVPDDDDEAMAKAILRLLNDPALAGRLSANGRQLAERSSWENVRLQWEELFAQVMSTGGTSPQPFLTHQL